jgi:hypothetical protein
MARFMLPILLLAAGCFWEEPQTAIVPDNPFGYQPASPPPTRTAYAPSSVKVAALVDSVGRKIVKANPQLGMDPQFRTIGAPQPEIFHRGVVEILITEGLAQQCATEGQLAAVLCQELGKMVVARDALAGAQARVPEKIPPADVAVGNDNAGAFGPADQLHRAELAKYEAERQRKVAFAQQAPDPRLLARSYLIKAGYPASELDSVAPLLQTASVNTSFAKQLAAPPQAKQ